MKKVIGLSVSFFFLILFAGLRNTVIAQACLTGKLDPRAANFLKMIPPDNRSLEEQKKTTNFEELRKMGPPVVPYPATDVERIKVTVDSIPVLVFNPSHAKGLPIFVSYHAGGFISPLEPWMEYYFWYEAHTKNVIIFAVDYRVAPEYKFPKATEDAYSSFKWISEHGEEFGGDTSRIALTGWSSGANLVAVVSQKARKEGIEQRIKLQIMICPSTDNPDNSDQYPSMQQNSSGYFITKTNILFASSTYADHKDYNNPAFAPILSKDFSGLSPALIITAEFDPYRDQGTAYAEKLRKAGVKVWYKCFPGHIHSLMGLSLDSPEMKELDLLVLTVMKEVMNINTNPQLQN